MRTPLTTIIGWVDVLKAEKVMKDREHKLMLNAVEGGRSYLCFLVAKRLAACQRLLARVVDVLDITNIEQSAVVLVDEPFEMDKLFTAVQVCRYCDYPKTFAWFDKLLQDMVQLLLKPGVEFQMKTKLNTHQIVMGDYSRLYQVHQPKMSCCKIYLTILYR